MIYKVYANNQQFKEVEFKKGLNIILADRKPESGTKDTRNGVGKTSLINILHFCLGSRWNKKNKKDFPIEKIEDWIFSIELDICGERIVASRSIKTHNHIIIEGNTTDFPVKPVIDPENNSQFYLNDDWKKLLGICLFGIEKSVKTKYSPTFRSLISYFVRRGANAYIDPFKHFRNQNSWDWQVNNAFLLGLRWIDAAEAQEIKDEEIKLNTISKAIEGGIYPNKGVLESERIRLEHEIYYKDQELSQFKVLNQYKEIEEKVNKLTKSIHSCSNHIIILRQKVDRYKDSIASEKAPDDFAIEELYKEFNVHFPENAKQTLKEAKNFHKTIIKNRKEFLKTEIVAIENEIARTDREKTEKNSERSSLMQILNTHGALDEFIKLQEYLGEKKENLQSIKRKIKEIEGIAESKKLIKEEKLELENKIKRDYEETRPNWEKAVELFNENSLALYEQPGSLIINYSDKGYDFQVEIQRSKSEGISKMKIFCYDLTLVDLHAQKEKINFLVHDSTIFDGVDSRQRALALECANQKSIENNFQYICALNSDMLPIDDFNDDFDVMKFVRLRLTDEDPSGSLFGFEF